MTYKEKKSAKSTKQSNFITSNARYFAQMFMPLNEIFGNPGSMKIVSQEERRTVVIDIKVDNENSDGEQEADVSCVMLKPDYKTLADNMMILTPPDDVHS